MPKDQQNAPARQARPFDWQTFAAKLFCVALAIGASYFFLGTVVGILLPFVLAFLLAALIRPLARFLEDKIRFPRRVGAILLLLLVLAVLSWVLVAVCGRLIGEARRLLAWLTSDPDALGKRVEAVTDFLTGITSHLPFFAHLKERETLTQFFAQVDAALAGMLSDMLARLSGRIPEWIGGVVGRLPGMVIFLFTFLLSAFYCCADDESIARGLVSLIPAGLRERFPQGRARLWRVAGRYLRAYLLLFLLTFAELLIGFAILRLPYVFLPALLTAVVDFLPVLGVGTVLVPWGVIELLRGNIGVGTGLLILYGVMLLLRQLEEPRIIGSSLGLHPLTTLFAVYVGLRLFGIPGMILAPPAALLVKSLLARDAGEERGEAGGEDEMDAEGASDARENKKGTVKKLDVF